MVFRRDATQASLAYRYHNPDWDLARNREVYGEDHSVDGVGANMTIWLEVEGEEDMNGVLFPENGLEPFLRHAKQLLDHRCLFEVEPWFQNRVPTLENVALFLWQSIAANPPPRGRWSRVILEENEHWRAEVSADPLALTHTIRENGWQLEATVCGQVDGRSGLLIERERFRAAIRASLRTELRLFFRDLKSHLPQLIRLRAQTPLPHQESYEIACVAR